MYPRGRIRPLVLTTVTVPNSTLRIFDQSLLFSGLARASGGYSVWQAGRPRSGALPARYRETVVVTFSSRRRPANGEP